MSSALLQLQELAGAAETHARLEHGLSIGSDAVDLADRILRAEAGHPERFESLAACYGAWLGRLAAQRWQAHWVGLSEETAPRLRIGGVLVSPMDAVRRRLENPGAESLPEIVRRMEEWSREKPAARTAWDSLALDARFAGPTPLPDDPTAALDEWIRSEGIRGKDVLCLGAGGGRQGPLHARAGANVTVVDISERQLDHDRRAAVKIRTVCASMDSLEALDASSFDVVIQPVSACYVPDVRRVYAEVARVIRPGGLYVVQHKQPAGLQANPGDYVIANPCSDGLLLPGPREDGAPEFLHSLDALLGGLCAAGFVIEDFMEPPRADALAPVGSPGHRAWFLPPYLKIKARRNLGHALP